MGRRRHHSSSHSSSSSNLSGSWSPSLSDLRFVSSSSTESSSSSTESSSSSSYVKKKVYKRPANGGCGCNNNAVAIV